VYFGWRGSFWALAPLGLVTALLWWQYARDTPALHPGVDAAERTFIGVRTADPTARGSSRDALMRRDVWLVAASYFCMNVVFLLFSQWLFQYLVEERGFSTLESGWLYMLPFLVGAAFASIGGYTCDRLCARFGAAWGHRVPAVFGLLMVAALLFAGGEAPNAYVAVGLLALCFGFTQFTEGVFWSATTFAAAPHTATATGLLNTGGNVAGFLAPLIGWVLDTYGWHTLFAMGSAFAVAAAALWLLVALKTVPTPVGRIRT
jgi:ACS family glucarate transporter-like MFS transporter